MPALGRLWAVLAVIALSAAGCGSIPDYPANLSFPSRSDRLVLKSPESVPPGLNTAGKLDDELARLDSLGGKTAEPGSLPLETRTAIDRFLRETFGTPSAPTITGDADTTATAERLGLTTESLNQGGKLYLRHCLQCHNLSGDGRGPAGLWVVPFPRDFRRGEFKFTTTGSGKPRRADLMRTLTQGLIKGTAMPAFGLLPDGERDLLARYASYLAIRGQVETRTLTATVGASSPGDATSQARTQLGVALAEWEQAEKAPAIVPVAPDDGEPQSATHGEAVRRGFTLFTAKADNSCITCHAEFGRKPLLRFDVWGLVAQPADFTALTLKGSTRPEDVFARIRGGIPAVGMPAHPEFTDRQVWDLVRFVRAVPFSVQLPESPLNVRAAVYP